MKKFIIFIFLTLIILFVSFKTQAQIFSSDREEIFFAPNKIHKEVTWSAGFLLKEDGLKTETFPANQSRDVWIQTHAFPIGMSWRPPTSTSFKIYFDGSVSETDPSFPIEPRIYIRYSCDKTNWSTWYNTNTKDKKTEEGLKIYEVSISLPQAAVEKYNKLKLEWWKTKPAWSSDEHEFCEWLIKKFPDFFAKEFPFIGYVQIRLEKFSVSASQTIKSLTVEYGGAVSGLSSPPNDKSKVRKNTGDKWFFVGKKNQKALNYSNSAGRQ
jgi:hypothetical protein